MGMPMSFAVDESRPILHDVAGDNLYRRVSVVNIDDYVHGLEEERGRIGARLGRELPLCMSLIGGTIDKLKVEATQCKAPAMRRQPVLEEFLPVRGCKVGDQEKRRRSEAKDCRDKRDWMRSAQLWTDPSTQVSEKKLFDTKLEAEELHPTKDVKQLFGGNKACDSESICSLKKFACKPSKNEDKIAPVVADLTLMVPSSKNISTNSDELGFKSFFGRTLSTENQAYLGSQHHMRKARRCWSQELHRKFVKALEQLGGAKVATPKQIRDHMRVNDLTNDEVKSHLQKYRIHLRRSSQSAVRSLSQPLCTSREVIWDSHNPLQPSRPSSSHSSHRSPFQRECTFDSSGDGCIEDDEKSYESKLRH